MNYKNIFLVLLIALVLASCGGSSDSTTDSNGDITADEDGGTGVGTDTGTDTDTDTDTGTGTDTDTDTDTDTNTNTNTDTDTDTGSDGGTDILVTPSGLDLTPLQIQKFTTENVEAALEAYIGLLRGDDQVRVFNEFLRFVALLNDSDSGFQLLSVTDQLGSQIFTCPDGGQLSLRSIIDDGEINDIYTIESCIVNGETFDGGVSVQRDSSDVRGFENSLLSVAASSQLRIASGIVEGTALAGVSQNVATDLEGNQRFSTLFGLGGYFRVLPDGDTLLLLGSSSYVESGIADYPATTLSGQVGARMLQTFNAGVTFDDGTEVFGATSALNELLAGDLVSDFQVGQLNITINSDTGNSISMAASNGDPASFDVVIFDDGSVVNSMTIPWSDRFRFKRPLNLNLR